MTFQLADNLELRVNVGSGNALVRTVDLTQPATTRNVSLGVVYNSLLLGSGADLGRVGYGWRTREGGEQMMFESDTDGSVVFIDGDGVSGKFTLKSGSTTTYNTPKEFKADLVKTASGWTLTYHDDGHRLEFDSSGFLDQNEDRNGNYTHFSYVDGDLVDIEFFRRGTGQAPQAVDTADQIGTVYPTTNANDLISEYRQSDGASTTRRVAYGYNSGKELTSITEPAGEVIRFGYGSGHLLTSITNGEGRQTTVGYDSSRRVTSVTQTGDGDATTRLTYPSSTQTLVADPNTDQSQPVASVPHTTYTVNSSKRVTDTVDPAGKSRKRSYTPFFDVATATNAIGGTTTNTYAANNGESLTTSQSSTGASVSFAYANPPTSTNPTANFQPSSSTDAQKNVSAYTYTGAGNLASSRDALAATAKVDYNADGTAKSSTDPMNGTNSTTYAYDEDPFDETPWRQLTRITPPSGNSLGVRNFTYDGFGRLRTATDGAGRTASYTYDLDDRVKTVTYSDGTPAVGFTYDRAGNLTRRTDASGTTTWTYNVRNQVLTRTATSGGGILTYTYDRVGNLKTLKDGRGTTSYTYDVRNLLTNLTDGAGKPWRFKYDDDGRRNDTYFNSTSDTAYAMRTHTTYDNDGRIKRITTTRASSSSTVVSDVSYCFAPFVSGQPCPTASSSTDTSLRQWSRDEKTGTVSQFTYDKGNHLTRATNVDGHTYDFTYDANANRATQKVDGTQNQSLTFNSANQITNAAATYDGAGNQTTLQAVGGNYTLAYNAARQMTKTTAPAANGGATNTFTYAGPDQVELVAAGTTKYVYGIADQFNQPWIQSFSRSGQTGYIERDGSGAPLGLNLNGTDHAYVLDTLGSVIGLIDANGNVTATYGYNPYGTIGTQTGTTSAANPIRYTGGLALDDTNTRLTKLGHRYVTTQYGRFTQQDSITLLANPTIGNRYAYVACNPINNIDPTGLQTDRDELAVRCGKQGLWWAAGGAIAGIAGGPAGVIGGAAGGLIAGAGSCIWA